MEDRRQSWRPTRAGGPGWPSSHATVKRRPAWLKIRLSFSVPSASCWCQAGRLTRSRWAQYDHFTPQLRRSGESAFRPKADLVTGYGIFTSVRMKAVARTSVCMSRHSGLFGFARARYRRGVMLECPCPSQATSQAGYHRPAGPLARAIAVDGRPRRMMDNERRASEVIAGDKLQDCRSPVVSAKVVGGQPDERRGEVQDCGTCCSGRRMRRSPPPSDEELSDE